MGHFIQNEHIWPDSTAFRNDFGARGAGWYFPLSPGTLLADTPNLIARQFRVSLP
jgi:hypothetical protein